MLAATCAVLVVCEAVARQGLTLAAPPAMAGESLDSDGDGSVSDVELAGSSFFKKVDTDDDGTLSGSELLRVAQRFNVGDVMDVEQGVRDAVQHVNQDEKSGIQVNDLSSHWRRLTSLATPEEVAEWVEHAVLLPRYADAFRENSVKGFDLPMLLEDAELLQDLGVESRFHVRQIQRAISVRLFGLASLPGAPKISCERSRDDPEHVIARWDLSETEVPPDSSAHVPKGSAQGNDSGEKSDKEASGSEGSPRSLPIHRLRVFARTTDGMGKSKPWRPAGVLDDLGTHKLTVTGVPANANVELRIEAWNAVGRSAYSYARCGNPSTRKSATGSENKAESKLPRNDSEALKTPVPKQTTSTDHHDRSHDSDFMPEPNGKVMRDVFSNADLDGDGDIDGTELRQYVNELSEGIKKRPGAEVSPRETELRKFIESRGVEVGIAAMDDDEDAVILPTEFELRWKGMQRLMTASKTADWIANAVELPQHADKFRENGFTGFELAQLIGKHGDERLHELGIHDAHHRSLITRAISVLFMGLGTAPTQHFYLEPQPGDTCGSIKLKWTKMGHAISPKDELPIHKYRVLRREANAPESDPWVTVYSGLSTSAEDLHLNTRKKYLYRVEAWNLIGVSPASETLPVSPNLEACVSVVDMFWRLVKNILLLPITLLTLVIDNYYRIMAAASVLGGLVLFSNTPAWEKVRLLRGVRERFTLMLKSHFGTAFGLDFALTKLIKYFERRVQVERQMSQHGQDDDNPITPRSPHHDIVSRAVEAAFPSVNRGGNGSNRGWLGRGSGRNPVSGPQSSASAPPRVLHPATLEATRERGDSTHLQRHISIPLSPSSESKWEIVKRHVVLKRAVNAFKASVYDLSSFQSDTDNSSQISSDNANASPANGKTKRAKIGSTIRKRTTKALSSPIDLIKGLASQDSRSTTPSPPPAAAPPTSVRRQMMLSAGGSSSIEANIRRCGRCNEKVSSHSRHTCGGCHLVFCRSCTAYKSHGPLRSCDVESKCRCIDCVEAETSFY